MAIQRSRDGVTITLASGGHPAPLLRRNSGEIEVLDAPTDRSSGVIPDPYFPQITAELEPGSVLLLERQTLLTNADGHDAHEILE